MSIFDRIEKRFPRVSCKVFKHNGIDFDMSALETESGKKLIIEEKYITPNIIETNDIIEICYSNGSLAKFEVIEPGYKNIKINNVPVHYEIQINRLKQNDNLVNIPNINNTGNGNVIITANSSNSNIQVIQDLSKFDEIKNTIQNASEIENKEVLLQILEELKSSTYDKNKFQDSYNKLITNFANHIAILTPFMPYLVSFFSN